jgi:competence protein ComEC
VLALLCWVQASHAGTLTTTMLDVGQGDSIVLQSPAGKTVLIDAGDGKIDVVPLLGALHVKQLDLVVATHPHADHIGGMDEVLAAFPVKLYTDNGLPHTTRTYEDVMKVVEAKGIAYRTAQTDQVFNLDDGIKITVLQPSSTPLTGTRSDLNSNSVVVRVDHGTVCLMFTGDSEDPTEDVLLQRGIAPCQVLKVAHHGSAHSTSDAWLRAVRPESALISVGKDNSYGHPDPGTLARLESNDVEVFRTDELGSIQVLSDGKSYRVVPVKLAPLPIETNAPPVVAAVAIGAVQAVAPLPPPSGDAALCPFTASRASEVFHEESCGNGARISSQNRVCYASREAALAAGKRPAGCCKP